jgi:hypothetical protein
MVDAAGCMVHSFVGGYADRTAAGVKICEGISKIMTGTVERAMCVATWRNFSI